MIISLESPVAGAGKPSRKGRKQKKLQLQAMPAKAVAQVPPLDGGTDVTDLELKVLPDEPSAVLPAAPPEQIQAVKVFASRRGITEEAALAHFHAVREILLGARQVAGP